MYTIKEPTFKIVISTYRVKYTIAEGLTYPQARQFAEDYNWEFVDENDFIWDLDIEEED